MIIGLTGTLGSGKSTVVGYLEKKGFKRFSVSDTSLKNEALKRGREPDRQARHDIANEYRSRGATKLMEAVYGFAKASVDAGENIVLEPQHTVAEVKFIQDLGGKVIGVDADIRTRYERILKRGSEKDQVSFEEFRAFQELESESDDPNANNLIAAGKAADIHVRNDGTKEEFERQIEEALKKIL